MRKKLVLAWELHKKDFNNISITLENAKLYFQVLSLRDGLFKGRIAFLPLNHHVIVYTARCEFKKFVSSSTSGIVILFWIPAFAGAKILVLFMQGRSESGFSLFELLIVLTIIGILTAISYPIYIHALIKAHRAEAKIALINLANRMEIYYLENNHSYANATLENLGVNKRTDNKLYQLALITTANTYELTATAIFSDPECHRFTLDNLGVKKNTGSLKSCW